MSYLIINSLFIVVIFASALMGVFLIYLAYKIGKEEESKEEAIMKANEEMLKRDDNFSIFDITDLKK